MADNYREMMEEASPPFLTTQHGAPVVRAIGDVKDSLLWGMREAVKIRFPKYATEDSIAATGAERRIIRGPYESFESYQARVREAWTSWASAGSALAMLKQLSGAGYDCALEIVNGRQYTLDSDGELQIDVLAAGSWFVDPDPTHWAYFDVIVRPPFPWGSGPVPADDSNEAEILRRIVRLWQPQHMTCTKIVIYDGSGIMVGYPPGIVVGDPTYLVGDTTYTHWTP